MKRLDAAFIWGGNGKTYLFKGSKYWRYNEKQNKVDPGYPKNISEAWGAVRQPVDSVMTWKDKQTYFFKGKTFSKYEYHKWLLYKPEKISEVFYKCEPDNKSSVQVARGNNDRENNDRGNNDLAKNGASRATLFAHFITLLTIVASFGNCWWWRFHFLAPMIVVSTVLKAWTNHAVYTHLFDTVDIRNLV